MRVLTIPGENPSKYQGRVYSLLPPGWLWSTLANSTVKLSRYTGDGKSSPTLTVLTRIPNPKTADPGMLSRQRIAVTIAATAERMSSDVNAMKSPQVIVGMCKETLVSEHDYPVELTGFDTPEEVYNYLSGGSCFDVTIVSDSDTFQESVDKMIGYAELPDTIAVVLRENPFSREVVSWLRKHPAAPKSKPLFSTGNGDRRPDIPFIPHQYRSTDHVSGRKERWSVRWMGAALKHEAVPGFSFEEEAGLLISTRFFEAFLGHRLSVRAKLDFQIGELIKGGLFDQKKMPAMLFVEVNEQSPMWDMAKVIDGVWLQFAPKIIDEGAAFSDMGMGYLSADCDVERIVNRLAECKVFSIVVPVPHDSLRAKLMEKYIRTNGVALEGLIDHVEDTKRI